jgi:hypothetical protein
MIMNPGPEVPMSKPEAHQPLAPSQRSSEAPGWTAELRRHQRRKVGNASSISRRIGERAAQEKS